MYYRKVSEPDLLRALMREEEPLTDVGGGHAIVPRDWAGRRHFSRAPNRSNHMLWEVERGTLVAHDESGDRPISEGSGMWLCGSRGGDFRIADDTTDVAVHFFRFQLGNDPVLTIERPLLIGACHGVKLADIVELFRTCDATGRALGWVRLRCNLAAWLGEVFTHADQPAPGRPGLAPAVRRKCLWFIRDHLTDGFSLRELADHCGLNPTYLSAQFKVSFGQSIRSYVTHARIGTARNLLLDTDLSVTEIARQLGYCDVYYFTRQFKRLVGMAPGKWRMRQGR